MNYIQKDISNHNALIGEQEMKIKDLRENLGEDFKVWYYFTLEENWWVIIEK